MGGASQNLASQQNNEDAEQIDYNADEADPTDEEYILKRQRNNAAVNKTR
jgi:hypothetical protein